MLGPNSLPDASLLSAGGQTREFDVPPEDELFDIIANQRRRLALQIVQQVNRIELGTLAERVAAWEDEIDVQEVTSAKRKNVYTALQQTHLPKMDRVGIIEFDDREGVVKATPALEEVDVHVEIVRGKDIPWSEYYLGLSLVALATLVTAWGGFWPLASVSTFSWGVFFVVAFLFSAGVHYLTDRKLDDTEQPI